MPFAKHAPKLPATIQPTVVANGSTTPCCGAGSRGRFLALGIAALCTVVSADAASNTWTGAVDLNWDAFTPNWTSPSVWVNDDDAIFSGTGSAINVGNVSAQSISITANGYTFAGSPLTLSGFIPTIDVSAGVSTSFANALTGSAGLQKSGAGTVILTGANNYAGATVINAGTLQIGNATSNGTVGSGMYSIASGATLFLNYATAATPPWANISGEGTLRLNSAQAINGSANWSTTGVALPATFLGTLQMDRGRINAQPSSLGGTTNLVIGDGAQFLAFDGTSGGAARTYTQNISIKGMGWGEAGQNLGALRVSGMNATFSGNITLTGSSGLYTQSNTNPTMNVTGPISDGGSGYSLTINAAGSTTITLSNPGNNYAGDTLIATGRLKLGASEVIPDGIGKGNVSVTGTLDLNAFNESINGLSGNGTVDNVAGAGTPILTVGNHDATSTFGGVIKNTTGTLSLTKVGAGILTLGGASTYSGATNVNGGALLLNNGSLSVAGSVAVGGAGVTFGGKGSAGSVTVNAGGTLQGGIANTGSLALASLTFTGNSPLSIQPAAGATASVAVSGSITTSGTQTINVTGSPLMSGSYRLLSFGSIIGDGLGAFVLGSTPQPPGSRPRTYTLDTTTSPLSYIGLNVLADGAIWSGAVNGAWDATTANWKLASDGTTSTTYFNADDVQFSDTTGNRNVVISGSDVSPTTVVFNNSTGNDYTISGTHGITGAATFVKNGAGKLTITNTNSFTGGTTISAGTLELGDGTTSGVIAGNIANAASLVFRNASAQTFAGVISGAGTLTKSGNGTLVLSGTNSYAGSTDINGGVLSVGTLAPNGANSGIGAGSALTLDGGTLQYTGASLGSNPVNTQFNRAITVNAGGGTIDVAGNGFLFYNGALAGSGTLKVVDTSGDTNNRQLLVTGDNPGFSGSLSIGNGSPNSGWVQYRSNAAAPFGSGTITVNGGGILSADNGLTNPTALSNAITLNGGTIQAQAALVRYNGPVTVVAGTTSFLVPAPATNLEIGGNISGSGNLTEAIGNFSVRLFGDNSGYTGTYLHSGSGATIFDSATAASPSAIYTINNAAGRYLANLAGTPTIHLGALSGTAGFLANLMSGSTATFSVGALNTDTTFAGNINNVASGSTGITAFTKVGTGTLTLSGTGAVPTSNSAFSGDLTVNGGKLIGAAARTGSNTVFGLASSARTITVNAGATLEFQAPNTFGNHNTITVPTLVINGGTVTNADPALSSAINNALNNVVLTNGTLTSTTGSAAPLDAPRNAETYGSWNINGTVTSDGTSFISTTAGENGQVMLSSAGADTTFAVNSGTLIVSAPLISGDASFLSGLVKTGPGTMVLAAANTYTGVTTVNDGTLIIGGSISGSIVNLVGGTLAGGGETGAINLSGGTLAPGSGSGIGTITTGGITFTGGTFALEINTSAKTSDLVKAFGDLYLSGGGALSLSIVNPSATPLAVGQLFTLIDYTGAWDTGTFAGYADDSTFTLGLDTYRISYDGVDNVTDEVVLQVVPEPSAVFSLLGGMGALLGLRRRRK